MGILSTQATSRRGYLSQDELEQMADITVTNSAEADDQISQAEEMIDSYVGPQDKFYDETLTGLASAGASTSITLESAQQNTFDIDYFKLCEVEIIGGTGAGQRRKITGSTKAGVLTIDTAWDTNPDTTSYYKISQIGKFPRDIDVDTYTSGSNTTYYKQIPEAVKRAVASQVQYVIEMGASYFSSDKADMQSESIGDYSYSKAGGTGSGNIGKMISPKAKMLLNGIYNRVGKLIWDMSLNSLLNQKITITTKTGYNAYGRETVSGAKTVYARFQKTQKLNFNPLNPAGNLASLKNIVAIAYVPPDTVVVIDDKVTYDSIDYKVDGIYDAIGGTGHKNHIKLELVKWKAT
jgi:hypothetical protein